MQERTYRCNFCREVIDPVASNSRRPGIGVEWQVNDGNPFLRELAMIRAEHHVCLQCLRALRALEVPNIQPVPS